MSRSRRSMSVRETRHATRPNYHWIDFQRRLLGLSTRRCAKISGPHGGGRGDPYTQAGVTPALSTRTGSVVAGDGSLELGFSITLVFCASRARRKRPYRDAPPIVAGPPR